ncbi:MAG TPA: phosphate--acyl-ACP acyltransferase, partial [Bryobacteraceae bacterium]
MLTIAVDAMGGDHAPKREIEGAIRAAEELQIGVILVGQERIIRNELRLYPQAGSLPIEVRHASEVITMDDSAAKAVRTKKDSSIRVACRLVRDGVAQGVVSAGT